jgi:hypothetical protein
MRQAPSDALPTRILSIPRLAHPLELTLSANRGEPMTSDEFIALTLERTRPTWRRTEVLFRPRDGKLIVRCQDLNGTEVAVSRDEAVRILIEALHMLMAASTDPRGVDHVAA